MIVIMTVPILVIILFTIIIISCGAALVMQRMLQ